jgi:hypothetical protein
MTIGQEEKLHGVAILRLFEEVSQSFPAARFSLLNGESRSSYVLKGRLLKEKRHLLLGSKQTVTEFSAGLFVKTSMKRASPWGYNFTLEHQDEIKKLKEKHGEVFLIFVNGDDGIACLDYMRSKQLLDEHHEEQEWVRVSRKPRQAYRLSGNDGDMDSTLPANSFPKLITNFFDELLGVAET